MTEDKKFEDSVDFVVRNYRHDAFSVDKGWRRLGLTHRVWWRSRWAAACAVTVALAASAGIYAWLSVSAPTVTTLPATETVMPEAAPTAPKRSRIEFNDTPLDRVVKEIEAVYGVTVTNVPEGGDYRLTLSYEGTARELVATINDLLDIRMEVEE
ncbi:MAG: DUF4974 domain-containing protein [Pseudoflavonifractor sp.]|nr:DUF4974 domain-containing protein [Pseudoflavonifractor sp.]